MSPNSDALRRARGRPAVPASAQSPKRHNLALVLRAIADGDRPSRAQVAATSGLTKATVSSLVDTLVAAGLVIAGKPDRGLVGRPGSPLELDPRGPAGLGVEINVDYVAACVVDFSGMVRHEQVVTSDLRDETPAQVMELATSVAAAALGAARIEGVEVAGLTVAVPGLVDHDGRLRRAPNLPGWDDLDVAGQLAVAVGAPFTLVGCDNEANLAALAEHWFAPGIGGDFVHVSGEVGVGAGLVIAGELWRGPSGFAAELGHVMIQPDGPRCTCGARGCLEQFAGLDALLRASGAEIARTGRRFPGDARKALIERAEAGDPATVDALRRAGDALGAALAGLVNLVGVSAVVLGGLYADLARWLVEPVTTELTARVLSHTWAPVTVSVSSLGATAAIRGAGAVTTQTILADPAAWLPEMLNTTAIGG
jgi:predicted NBD/HSP70 family sugar kinase